MSGRPIGRGDHGIGALLALGYVLALLATVGELGMSRDESFYVRAAESYGSYLRLLVEAPGEALSQPVIDRAFRINHEHPPLAKYLFALGHLAHGAFGVPSPPSLAHRFGGMLCAGLLLWLIYISGARYLGRRAGLFAALAYALLPRPFYHAHLNCFDVPITLAITACAYVYLDALRRPRALLTLGVVFGLSLATKHNSWALPIIFVIHFALLHLLRVRAGQTPAQAGLGRRPDFLLAMLALGVPLFLALWPWLWSDTLPRLSAYAAFHLKHAYYNMAYFGENYFWPPFPWSFPWVMTLFTVPLATLFVGAVGIFLGLRAPLRALRERSPLPDPRAPAVLWLGCMLAPLVMISLPSTPIFGGTKHWMTGYPFLALFAGAGFDALWRAALERFPGLSRPRLGALPALFAGATLLAPALVETAHSHPFGLSHYGVAAGGVPGAARLGMNRQFWGFTTGSLAPYLRRALPEGGSVYLCDTTALAFRMLQRDGRLPDDIRPSADLARADLALVHHELHFAEVDFQLWSSHGSVAPAHVLSYDGVPIISVYRNPASKRVRSP